MPAFRNSNYRPNQYSEERTDQYQQFEEKPYNTSESSEGYRKDYSRSGSIPNFNANYNNRQQYTSKSWVQKTPYQSTRQSYQPEKDRQTPTNMTNPSKYSKPTNFNKPQHPIYNKFQKYPTNFSYQQKTYHEDEEKKLKNEDHENFSANFAGLNDEGNELYYEKETIKKDDNDETFIEFIGIESTCRRCELSFASRNLLHVHIREAKCLKQTALTNLDNSKTHSTVKIVIFKASTSNQNAELGFRSWNFLQAFVKLIPTMKAILICLNTECDATLANKA